MASPLFENKVKKWDAERLAVRKSIANYNEYDGYFTELEQMAFCASFKKKEMDERGSQLKTFALGMAGRDPELSSSLNNFVSLCETLYGNPDFKATAKKLKLATDLLQVDDENKNQMKAIVEKDAREWHELALSLRNMFVDNDFGSLIVDFFNTLFYITGQGSTKPEKEIKELYAFANAISGKNASLGAHVQKFAALCQKYMKDNAKLEQFRTVLRERGSLGYWDKVYQDIRQRSRQAEEERRKKEEQERKAREEEERRRREAERRAREERQRREAAERERKAREEKQRAERERRQKALASFMKKAAAAVIVVLLLVTGYRAYVKMQTKAAFEHQIALGDDKMSEGRYQDAIAEYRKALEIDGDRFSIVNEKEDAARAEMRKEFSVLLDELKVILKADRNVFNEDSGKRLDRMLELFPENEECVKYRNMRERQQKRK